MIDQLKTNLAAVDDRISTAARKCGRTPESVRLIGVTKYVDAATTSALVEAGCNNLGENRPQVLWDKAQSLAALDVEWHMIGHLQRNKVKRTVECSSLIHSIDSQRLLKAVEAAALDAGRSVDVLLEVNVSGESAKHGFAPEELPAALDFVADLKHVSVKGMMCMAGLIGDTDDARREFAMLNSLKSKHQDNTPDNVDLKELSMGMSGDFEIAIEEGATMVRVGSLLFEGV